jgi:hypothetical protein
MIAVIAVMPRIAAVIIFMIVVSLIVLIAGFIAVAVATVIAGLRRAAGPTRLISARPTP